MRPTHSPTLAERLAALGAWADRFEEADFSIGEWVVEAPDADGVSQMPWYRYSSDAIEFLGDIGVNGWVEVFDWMAWAETPRGEALLFQPEAVATASVDELRWLLTALVRGDRFIEANIGGAYESGVLGAIARRAKALLNSRASTTPAPRRGSR